MKLLTVASALLFADAALGARFTEKRRAAFAKRGGAAVAARAGRGNPLLPAEPSPEAEVAASTNGTADVEYSSNWSGAVLISTGFTSVTGTFVVPTPRAPAGGRASTEYAASAWVGIDGDTAQNSILQTGVDFYIQNGQASYDAWYEWFPDFAFTFTGFAISANDTITVTVTASSKSAGTAVIENVSTGRTVRHSFSSESNTLEELNAEWIVEDFEEGGSLVPFANFGTVTFTDATAQRNGATVGPSGSTLIDIKQGSQVLTSASLSGDDVVVSYTA
ncbi:acid proteinase [Niveomyces insectorum RCEF 264]|uniref:Acid proteinase n=1 Tax=Niveomyces insectorum RCEF 264 TaxID=1081102 RepID=A0A167S3F2_9HYPO|nr:acid proteinase [Niveomyces insectorum RCEF 264]